MKIVVNAMSARLGGGRTYLVNLLAHLPERPDLEVLVFAPADLEWNADRRVRRVRIAWPTTNPLLRALWERLALPRFLRRERADVLFCPGGVVGSRPPPGCKVVTMFRNMIPFNAELVARMPWGLQRLRNLILRRVLLRSMAGADLTIFISDHARALIERLARIPNPVTIPHGIAAAFRSAGSALPRPAAAPAGDYLLYVSRLDVYKHHREVVQGFAALPTALRVGLHLVFLGETDLPETEPLARLVREAGMQGQVLMPGAVPYASLPAWYQHARAIVFASSCENCPNILLESLGAGRPVLCSNVMPMPEFGGDGLVYFSPVDPTSLHAALHRVLTDDALAQRVAAAAVGRSRHYDWAVTARLTWERILALAPARRHGAPSSAAAAATADASR
jgi:glycosyltransferase involved in cell wall biosynthesis